jgi:hypothetical protein
MSNRQLALENWVWIYLSHLEEQVVSLQQEILEKDTNRVPLGHVQDVCLSALEEIENLEQAFNEKLNIFKNHARIGLEAISALQVSKPKLSKPSDNAEIRRQGYHTQFTVGQSPRANWERLISIKLDLQNRKLSIPKLRERRTRQPNKPYLHF